MRTLEERLTDLPWEKYRGFIPRSKVPRRIRDALPHPYPYNTLWTTDWVFELTHQHLWRRPVKEVLEENAKLVAAVRPLLEAHKEEIIRSLGDPVT